LKIQMAFFILSISVPRKRTVWDGGNKSRFSDYKWWRYVAFVGDIRMSGVAE
jgi:hypothetical protein